MNQRSQQRRDHQGAQHPAHQRKHVPSPGPREQPRVHPQDRARDQGGNVEVQKSPALHERRHIDRNRLRQDLRVNQRRRPKNAHQRGAAQVVLYDRRVVPHEGEQPAHDHGEGQRPDHPVRQHAQKHRQPQKPRGDPKNGRREIRNSHIHPIPSKSRAPHGTGKEQAGLLDLPPPMRQPNQRVTNVARLLKNRKENAANPIPPEEGLPGDAETREKVRHVQSVTA